MRHSSQPFGGEWALSVFSSMKYAFFLARTTPAQGPSGTTLLPAEMTVDRPEEAPVQLDAVEA